MVDVSGDGPGGRDDWNEQKELTSSIECLIRDPRGVVNRYTRCLYGGFYFGSPCVIAIM